MRKMEWFALAVIAITLLVLAACSLGDGFADVAPRASATSLAGQVVTFGSTMGNPPHSQISIKGGGGYQLDVAIEATRIYNPDGSLNTTRPSNVGDKGILIQEDGIWYIDVYLEP